MFRDLQTPARTLQAHRGTGKKIATKAIFLRNQHDWCLPESDLLSHGIQYGNLTVVFPRREFRERQAEFQWQCLRLRIQTIDDFDWRCFERLRLTTVERHKCDERLRARSVTL